MFKWFKKKIKEVQVQGPDIDSNPEFTYNNVKAILEYLYDYGIQYYTIDNHYMQIKTDCFPYNCNGDGGVYIYITDKTRKLRIASKMYEIDAEYILAQFFKEELRDKKLNDLGI